MRTRLRSGAKSPADDPPVEGAREWVSLPDPEHDTTWLFDVTFLESNWSCIYGRGCLGVLTGPAGELAEGCCSYGAHFTGEDDRRRVAEAADRLTDSEWQFKALAKTRNGPVRTNRAGEIVTRLTDGACIFLNRPGFAAGPGCALHTAALARGEQPLAWKPDVCWQIPLHRKEENSSSGHMTVTIRQWDRDDWGAGGREFHWWCTETPEAFVGTRPVHEELRDELAALIEPAVHAQLDAYLRQRRLTVTAVPHPALRRARAQEV